MGPEDQTTAGKGGDVTVSKHNQASSSTKTNINHHGESLVSKHLVNTAQNERTITTVEEYRATMVKTTTMELGRLMLAAAIEPKPADLNVTRKRAAKTPINSVLCDRRPCDIILSITIKVFRSKAPTPAFNITVPANKCGRWSDLRGEVMAASWENAHVTSLCKVTFRLEEDGKAASMTIAPTKIDAQTAFPGKMYEGWYYRILRGKQTMYTVDVKIDV